MKSQRKFKLQYKTEDMSDWRGILVLDSFKAIENAMREYGDVHPRVSFRVITSGGVFDKRD